MHGRVAGDPPTRLPPARPPARPPCTAPLSVWSLAALLFVGAFTLPAAYSRRQAAIHSAVAAASAATSARWEALGLTRKKKVGWVGGVGWRVGWSVGWGRVCRDSGGERGRRRRYEYARQHLLAI